MAWASGSNVLTPVVTPKYRWWSGMEAWPSGKWICSMSATAARHYSAVLPPGYRSRSRRYFWDFRATFCEAPNLPSAENYFLNPVPNPTSDSIYGVFGMAPGANRSDRSLALAASFKKGATPKMSCIVRKSEECV